jgi:hypothetical protein
MLHEILVGLSGHSDKMESSLLSVGEASVVQELMTLPAFVAQLEQWTPPSGWRSLLHSCVLKTLTSYRQELVRLESKLLDKHDLDTRGGGTPISFLRLELAPVS